MCGRYVWDVSCDVHTVLKGAQMATKRKKIAVAVAVAAASVIGAVMSRIEKPIENPTASVISNRSSQLVTRPCADHVRAGESAGGVIIGASCDGNDADDAANGGWCPSDDPTAAPSCTEYAEGETP